MNIWKFVSFLFLANVVLDRGVLSQNATASGNATGAGGGTCQPPAGGRSCVLPAKLVPALDACLTLTPAAARFSKVQATCGGGQRPLTIKSPTTNDEVSNYMAAQSPPIPSIWLDLRVQGTAGPLMWGGTDNFDADKYNNISVGFSSTGHNADTCIYKNSTAWVVEDCSSNSDTHHIICEQIPEFEAKMPTLDTKGVNFQNPIPAGTTLEITCEALVGWTKGLRFVLKSGSSQQLLKAGDPGVTGSEAYKMVNNKCSKTAVLTWKYKLKASDDGNAMACVSNWYNNATPCSVYNDKCALIGNIKIGGELPTEPGADSQQLLIIVAGGGGVFALLMIVILFSVCKKKKPKAPSEPPAPEPVPEPEPEPVPEPVPEPPPAAEEPAEGSEAGEGELDADGAPRPSNAGSGGKSEAA